MLILSFIKIFHLNHNTLKVGSQILHIMHVTQVLQPLPPWFEKRKTQENSGDWTAFNLIKDPWYKTLHNTRPWFPYNKFVANEMLSGQ